MNNNIDNNNKITTNIIDNDLYNFFKESFKNTLSIFTSYKSVVAYPYYYYQSLAIKTFIESTMTTIMTVYQGNEKLFDIFFDKKNLLTTITLFKPTLIISAISLIYALVNTVSQYGYEKVSVYVKDKSVALIINVKNNSKEILNEIIIFMNKIQNDINEKIINVSIFFLISFLLYKYITK